MEPLPPHRIDTYCCLSDLSLQGAVRELGKGRVAVFTETAMFTTQLMAGLSFMPHGMNAPEASQNYRLLLNVIHWLDRR